MALDQTFCTIKVPLTEGNAVGLGFSGALEQALTSKARPTASSLATTDKNG
jgi:hypothetical protein